MIMIKNKKKTCLDKLPNVKKEANTCKIKSFIHI